MGVGRSLFIKSAHCSSAHRDFDFPSRTWMTRRSQPCKDTEICGCEGKAVVKSVVSILEEVKEGWGGWKTEGKRRTAKLGAIVRGCVTRAINCRCLGGTCRM